MYVPSRPTTGQYILTLLKKVNAKSIKERHEHQNPDPTDAELEDLLEPKVWDLIINQGGHLELRQGNNN